MGWGGASMKISHTHPFLFNFLNVAEMKIIFNKWDEVGMGVTRPIAILARVWNRKNSRLLTIHLGIAKVNDLVST